MGQQHGVSIFGETVSVFWENGERFSENGERLQKNGERFSENGERFLAGRDEGGWVEACEGSVKVPRGRNGRKCFVFKDFRRWREGESSFLEAPARARVRAQGHERTHARTQGHERKRAEGRLQSAYLQ